MGNSQSPQARVERGSAERPMASFPWLRRLHRLRRLRHICSILRILGVKKGSKSFSSLQDDAQAARCLLLRQDRCLLLRQDRCLLLRQDRCLLLRQDRCLLLRQDRCKILRQGWSRRLKSAACRPNREFWNSVGTRPARTGADRRGPGESPDMVSRTPKRTLPIHAQRPG